MNPILDVFKKNDLNTTPIWLMRQAGRYLPEYRDIRKRYNNFLELCYDLDRIVEISLQPIKRFDFDAAIIFSDILILPNALGWSVKFEESVGPVLQQFKSIDDFKYLKNKDDRKLNRIYDAINKVRAKLTPTKSLIGFAGSPWTVVTYLLEGKSKQDFSTSKKFIYQNQKLTQDLIEFITEKTISHLIAQVEAGCDVIQLFDSWAGIVNNNEYEKFVIKPTKNIVTKIKQLFPNLPIIGFPKGSGFLYEDYINNTGIDAISICQNTPLKLMQKWSKKIVVQGNLDPIILLLDRAVIEEKVSYILTNMSKENFIFNLGHGILPNSPIENVEFLVNYVRSFKR